MWLLVMTVGAGPEHRAEALAGARAQALAQVLGDGHVGQADDAAIGEREGAHIDGVALAVLAESWRRSRGCGRGIRSRRSSRRCASTAPVAATRGAASSRIQEASDSAISQRSTGAGVTAMRVRSASSTASSCTMSRPPQAPGPISRGIGAMAARPASRWSQAVGLAVTSAESKSGPAASRNDMRLQPDRRARTRQRHALRRRQSRSRMPDQKNSGQERPHQGGIGHDCGVYAGPNMRPLRQPMRRLTLAPAGEGPVQKAVVEEGNAMLGLMQDWPLLIHRIIDHAAKFHGERKVITRSIEGPIVETNYAADPRARAEGRAAARQGRHQARRPRGDAGLEHLAASGSLVRHPRHRRDLSHGQSAPVPRADRLDRQSRRRPHDDHRSHFRAALGKDRRQAADHRALHRAHRRRAYAEDHAEKRGRLRGLDRRSRRRFPMAPRSTRTPPPACATPPAPPGIPRACSIRTAPTCCTPSSRRCRIPRASPRATW